MRLMKSLLITSLLVIIPSSVTMAQYQNVQEKALMKNTPLEGFVSQQKALFNFDWKFQLVTKENKGTNFAAPALDDSSWRILDLHMIFSLSNPGRRQVAVHAASSQCVRDGIVNLSKQIHYGKGNG